MSEYLNKPLRADVKIISFDMVNAENLVNALNTQQYNDLLEHLINNSSLDLLERMYKENPHEIKDFLKNKLIK